MFRFFNKTQDPMSPLEAVQHHMKALGYELSDQGVAAAQLQLDAGMSPLVIASHFAVITMAYDLKQAGAAATGILRFRPHATELLDHINEYKDKGDLDSASWQQLCETIIGVSSINEQQAQWIERVLHQPAAKHLPLARHL